jgi:hypothetical protein
MIRPTLSIFAAAAFTASLTLIAPPAAAADQTQPGAGNAAAASLAQASPLVSSGRRFLEQSAGEIRDANLRRQTLDAILDPHVCIQHRAGLADADKDAIVQQLLAAGLLNAADAKTFPGGLRAGVFPPVLDDGSSCPHLPQPFYSAPGAPTGGHHTYPGGLVVHESFNTHSSQSFAHNYRAVFGRDGWSGLAEVEGPFLRPDVTIVEDIMTAAPLWHDWAKAIVLQWNADGSEFAELHIANTGGHHILGVAETIKRGFAPDFVVTQASAHTTPTEGNETTVVNYIRAASIIARVDPIARGYLRQDATGAFRLPQVRTLGNVDLNAAGRTNILVEYTLHNLSDSDWILAEPSVNLAELLLQNLAASFGYGSATPADYATKYRNPALSYLSAERVVMLYGNGGIAAVKSELMKLRMRGVI